MVCPGRGEGQNSNLIRSETVRGTAGDMAGVLQNLMPNNLRENH